MKAVRWLTYNGNHTESIGQNMGPNTLGEYLHVVEAEYDKEANKTRLGLAYGKAGVLGGEDK